MTDIYSFSEVEPEFVKTVIPISFYEEDECWIDPGQESGTYLFPAEHGEHGEEPEFAKMVIPIEAYEQDEFLSYLDVESDDFMPMVGNPFPSPNSSPGQPGAIM